MNDRRRPDLSEAFARMIKIMLMTIRARGWRCLKDLPKIWRGMQEFRRRAQALAALMAAFRAGKLPPAAPVPAPVPWPDPPEWDAVCAQAATTPGPDAQREPVARARQQSAERPALPAADVGPDRARTAAGVGFASARPRARGRTAVWLRPPRRALDPFAVFRLPTGIFATGRSP